jgi:hypothetical protein
VRLRHDHLGSDIRRGHIPSGCQERNHFSQNHFAGFVVGGYEGGDTVPCPKRIEEFLFWIGFGSDPELNMQEIFPPKLLGQADGPIAKLVFQDVAIQSRRSSIRGGSDHCRFG